jgi:DNA modification methylase
MEPYYDDGVCTIYHADCRDVLPDVAADVLLTDPPYGVAFDGKATKWTVKKPGGYIGEDSADEASCRISRQPQPLALPARA